MSHRRIVQVYTLEDGTSVIETVDGFKYRLSAERREAFHDDLIEELADVEEDMTVFTDEPHDDPVDSLPEVTLIYRSTASPRVYVLSGPDGDQDMNASEAKAILFGKEAGATS